MEQIRNVIVFGDSLSDIGIKAKTNMGWFAKTTGQMTTNASGRFSDCRNWTDFMYEDATGGETLIGGDPKSTITASQKHHRLDDTQSCVWPKNFPKDKIFYYANYAEGGACGDVPTGRAMQFALGQFKDQVQKFKADFGTLMGFPGPDAKKTLFLIWFGANDLYTAGCEHTAMSSVAETVASTRRNELVNIVGADNARFVFMNLPSPDASVRYQEQLQEAKGEKRIDVQFQQDLLAQGAKLYNTKLTECAGKNGDLVVDIAQIASPGEVTQYLQSLGLKTGAQKEGSSKIHIPQAAAKASEMAHAMVHELKTDPYPSPVKSSISSSSLQPVRGLETTSDKAHPTDLIYKNMWLEIKQTILSKYTFGLLS